MFETKIKSEHTCPRCGGIMFVVTRPVNVVELKCDTCESVLSVDYVQGWHDGNKSANKELANIRNGNHLVYGRRRD